ncbi:3-oxoacyl-[acyl-carrier-protein] synthase III C-terminal domain-containing protein [Sideroxydans sp. CL21]|uniref:type III polyketide synthase n=1 Tax=Sideroxydans sp. CL21 TaxID=2600596 RepID=UPI0024BCDBE9|nr:3-oxoacyl-[acyl-carrier-protein] synthase III C-terminal domain-containing protein [Sideroxydans sp. CL21]
MMSGMVAFGFLSSHNGFPAALRRLTDYLFYNNVRRSWSAKRVYALIATGVSMFINGLGTANPPRSYNKVECWEAFKSSEWFRKLDPRSRMIAEAVLTKENGIEFRSLAVASLDEVFSIDPDTLHRRFLDNAPTLGAAAGAAALRDAGIDADAIDGLVVSTCTGYLCPGLTSYIVERLGLRADVQAFDLVGQGCAAALPNWRLAEGLLSTDSCQNVLSICVEVSSAAMYLDNDPGVLISACLFGDGAGAAVLSKYADPLRRSIEWKEYASLVNPAERNTLLFETRNGMLRNVLTRAVPRLAAEHAEQVLHKALSGAGLVPEDISAWIMHAGGRDVLIALQNRLKISAEDLRYSADMLHRYGNMSSAFVYFVLQEALNDNAKPGWWWMSSFGAGFSCHGALLKVA